MTPAELWTLIQNTPACAPHIVPSEPKVEAAVARAGDQAIADILSVGRTTISPREVGDGAIAIALGIPDGPIFLFRLEQTANTVIASDAEPEQLALVSTARQAWRSVTKAALDVGNPVVRTALDTFVGSLLTADQAAAIKALAEVPDQITADQVSLAVRGPRE